MVCRPQGVGRHRLHVPVVGPLDESHGRIKVPFNRYHPNPGAPGLVRKNQAKTIGTVVFRSISVGRLYVVGIELKILVFQKPCSGQLKINPDRMAVWDKRISYGPTGINQACI